MPDKKLATVLQGIQHKLENPKDGSAPIPKTVSVEKVYETLQSQPSVRSASDFVAVFGPDMYLIYGCGGCQKYPLRSSSWYRCVRLDQANQEGGTDTKGHWRCCACLKKWDWGSGGEKRLVVVGDHEDYCMALIGEASQSVENKLNFLKACQMLTALDGRPVTKEHLLEVIKELNDTVEGKLFKFAEATTCTAQPVDNGCIIYCEDERLSMKRPGTTYRALDLDGRNEPLRMLEPDEQEFIIDVAAAIMNIEGGVAEGPAMKKTQQALLSNNTVRDIRHSLTLRLQGLKG